MQEFTQEHINQFLTLLMQNKVEIHAVTIYQHGKKLLEKAYAPFETTALHPLYSVSKSFLSMATGYLAEEKKIALDDPWISYFPEYESEMADEIFRKVTVRTLLTMSIGQDSEVAVHGGDDWAENVVLKKIVYAPGTKFFYNSMCSQMISELVQKVCGQKVVDLLAEKLFAPLGITEYYWEEDCRGHNTGGFGLHLKTSDLARFGLCCLEGGRYGGKQVLPPQWLKLATSRQIENASAYPLSRTENREGYGFHFWMCTHDAYRCSGLHGQLCFVQPKNELVVAMSSATSGSQAILDCLFKAMDFPKPTELFNSFKIPLISGKAQSDFMADALPGRHPALPNEAWLTDLIFRQEDASHVSISLLRNGKPYSFTAGCGEWTRQENLFEGFSEFTLANCMVNTRPEKQKNILFGNYAWLTDTTLQVQLRALDCSSGFSFLFELDGKYLTLHYSVQALYSPFTSFDVTFCLNGEICSISWTGKSNKN